MSKKPVLDAVRAIVIGSVVGAVVGIVLLGAFSMAFVSAESIPRGILSPLVIAISVLSAFAAGYIAARISKQRGLLFGTAAGMLLFAMFLFAGIAVSNKVSAEPTQTGVRLIVMVLSGAIGGILAVSRKSKGKRK